MSYPFQIKSFDEYKTAYMKSMEQPEAFWSEIASSFYWRKPWNKVLNWNFKEPKIEWFSGGKLNITENCIDRHLAALGQGCPAADLLPRPELVPAPARGDFPDRVSLPLGAGGRADRRPGDHADPATPGSRARATRRAVIPRSPDALLAEFEQRLFAFSLRYRRRHFRALDPGDRADPLSLAALRTLPVTHRRGADLL